MANRHDLRVYAAGDADEEDLCVEVRGAAVGGEGSGQVDCPEGYGGGSVLWRCLWYIGRFVSYIGSYVPFFQFLGKLLPKVIDYRINKRYNRQQCLNKGEN